MTTLPAPTRILTVDFIRDGGSYLLTFDASDGVRYSWFLPVRLDSAMHRTGWSSPRLSRGDTSESRELTWLEAERLGEAIARTELDRTTGVSDRNVHDFLSVVRDHGELK